MTDASIITQRAALDLFADEAIWGGKFNRLEVWRSHIADAGPYEVLTGDTWAPARVPRVLGDPSDLPGPMVNLHGRTLALRVDDLVDVVVTFAGTDPFTFATAAAEITAAGRGLLQSFVVPTGKLVVETTRPGLGALLRIVEGDAAPLLGLPLLEPGSMGMGRDARIPLIHGQSQYTFIDPNSAPSYFYRTRFFNDPSRLTSAFSVPFVAPPIGRLDPSSLIQGVVNLVDGSGTPIANRTVLVFLGVQAAPIDKHVVIGGTTRETTDTNGHAEFTLVRGTTITVSVAGTDLSRKVVVPTSPTLSSFDLLDPAYGNDDLFAVQRPNLPFAARRAL